MCVCDWLNWLHWLNWELRCEGGAGDGGLGGGLSGPPGSLWWDTGRRPHLSSGRGLAVTGRSNQRSVLQTTSCWTDLVT